RRAMLELLTWVISSSMASAAVSTCTESASVPVAPWGSVTARRMVWGPSSRHSLTTMPLAKGTGEGSLNHMKVRSPLGDSLSEEREPSSVRQALEPLHEISTLLVTLGEKSASGLATILAVGGVLHPTTEMDTVTGMESQWPSLTLYWRLSAPQ